MARVKEARSTNIQALATHDNGQATTKGSAVSEGVQFLCCPVTLYLLLFGYNCVDSD